MRSFSIGNTELMMLAAPVILLALMCFLVRKAVSGGVRDAAGSVGSSGGEPGVSTSEVLDRHYATGELTREEYLTIRDDIMREQNA